MLHTRLPSDSDAIDAAWQILERHGWLSERTEAVRACLRAIAKLRMFGAGQAIYLAGDTADGVYGLVEGALDFSIPRTDGSDIVIHRSSPGFWVGDLALFARQKRLVSVRAAVPSKLVYLPQSRLEEVIAAHPPIIHDFYILTHRNMATALRLLADHAANPADLRIALHLLMHDEELRPDDEWIRQSREVMAELVGVSVPTVQRALAQLERLGLIVVAYGRVKIRDRRALLRYCQEFSLEQAS